MSTQPSVPVARTRIKLVVFAAATIVAAAVGLPGPAVAALALTSLAIPLAVVLAGGAPLLRELLLPPSRPPVGRGLGHTPEERERFVT
ncbi:hypothetical protein ACFOOK_14860 [Micromonospora krabiensis]|uniref:Uncharacterized protein n=1 Tax=Micromonospora krabiensis TaxID=307121 RepID=A0A1C3N114_9ACTN|nr:hypothetical protein [Micromonospora krabiensis]SBV26282.1 hypothetical protein GA0070620_1769 [Micromonospora krabiensis]